MFGGPFVIGAERLKLYLPYHSRGFLRALCHSEATHFATRLSLQEQTPLARKIEAESAIVRHADPTIDRWVLGRGISFREARTLPTSWARYLAALRMRMFMRLTHRGAYFGQIDNTVAIDASFATARSAEMPWGAWNVDAASVRLAMCAANLAIMEEVLDTLRRGGSL